MESRDAGLTLCYGAGKPWIIHALGPIDIEIRKGEFFAVVGPSGCGKSTLLELIAGLTAPTEGEIEFEGRVIGDNVPDGVGVVFQEDACFPWLNVIENVEFGLRRTAIDNDEKGRRAAAVIDMMGLCDFARSYPAQLSGGMSPPLRQPEPLLIL